MGSVLRLSTRVVAALLFAASPLAHAQGFSADYRLAPAMSLGGDAGAGLSVLAGGNWFGQVGLAQGAASPLLPYLAHDTVKLAGGYRFPNGQSLSLQLSRARGQGLGLALNYDWPRYFVRLSYDQGLNLTPAESVRFSAGMRF